MIFNNIGMEKWSQLSSIVFHSSFHQNVHLMENLITFGQLVKIYKSISGISFSFCRKLISDSRHKEPSKFQRERSYNAELSLESIITKIHSPNGRSCYCFRVHGQIFYIKTSSFDRNYLKILIRSQSHMYFVLRRNRIVQKRHACS